MTTFWFRRGVRDFEPGLAGATHRQINPAIEGVLLQLLGFGAVRAADASPWRKMAMPWWKLCPLSQHGRRWGGEGANSPDGTRVFEFQHLFEACRNPINAAMGALVSCFDKCLALAGGVALRGRHQRCGRGLPGATGAEPRGCRDAAAGAERGSGRRWRGPESGHSNRGSFWPQQADSWRSFSNISSWG